MQKILNNIPINILDKKIVMVIAIIIIGIIIYKIIERALNRLLDRDKKHKRLDKKSKTMIKLIDNIIKYIIIVIVGVLILQIYGINVNSLIAGLGLVSVIAGLAIQDPLKDIVSGINIITDDYYSLGDVINIDGIEGKVVQLGVRTTKILDTKRGDIYVFANRNISKVTKVSEELYLDVPLSYEDQIIKQEKVLNDACEKIQKLENVTEAKYIGLNEFSSSALIYKIKILCKPEAKLQVKRQANRIIKMDIDKNKLSIPYTQITIHNANTKNS